MNKSSQIILDLKNIDKSYGETKVLENINISIYDNEFFTILGSSGSGKSTIIRMIGGFTKPSSGEIIYEDKIINNEPIFKRPFNTVFQDYALFPNMNVFNNVGFGLKIKNVNKDKIKEKVLEVLRIVGLENLANRMPQELSGGQQQRVALARAIICEPKVILLDEPLGALDAELRKQMQLFLKEIQKKIRITFIFITHDQEEAIFLSDRIAVLNKNKFEQVGTPKELYYSPNSSYMATFFGECNLFNCKILEINEDSVLLESSFGIFKTKNNSLSNKLNNGDIVNFGIRPEEISITENNEKNTLELEVSEIDFKGSVSTINVMDKNSNNEDRAFKGKNILITGASKGIGRAVSKELSKLGANIILLSKNEALLDSIYDEIIETSNTTPCIIKCDLSGLDEIKTQEIVNIISQDYKNLDCIIHNAATIEKMSNIEDFDLKSWEKILKVNLTSSFLLTKFLLPLMK